MNSFHDRCRGPGRLLVVRGSIALVSMALALPLHAADTPLRNRQVMEPAIGAPSPVHAALGVSTRLRMAEPDELCASTVLVPPPVDLDLGETPRVARRNPVSPYDTEDATVDVDTTMTAFDPAPLASLPESTALIEEAPQCSSWIEPGGFQTRFQERFGLSSTTVDEMMLELEKQAYLVHLMREFETGTRPRPTFHLAEHQNTPEEHEELRAPPPIDDDPAAGGEPYGEAPVDTSYNFLRQVDPLLNHGQWQVDVGLTYTMFDNDLSFLFDAAAPPPDHIVLEGRIRQRTLRVPFAIRYGLSDQIQLFLNAPVGWSNTELSYPGFDDFDNVGGIGDITAGASFLMRERSYDQPDVIGTVAVTAPAGNSNVLAGPQTPGAQLGQGFWAISGNVLFVQTLDPLVVFYGGGVRYQFENTFFDTINLQPGIEASYQFGVGFAINDRVTLSSSLLGSYITDWELNGVRLPRSSLEPVRMRFAATIAQPCRHNRILEPFVEIGLTDDAANFRLGTIITY